jgi:hypothetical protein
MKQQKELYLTHEEAIQAEVALKIHINILLEGFELIEGQEAKEAARNIIRNNREVLKKIQEVNRKFKIEYEEY